ncbi:WG repeat-containing protein [Flexithrix dorotheae]|uniref:WG repeat-containing protein n=1 Tax=Flexithrix dorotheae TaxID=70993 RepID=UPI000372EC4D|nr:WG repeat-containing protein [Flexithrix dorotheae]
MNQLKFYLSFCFFFVYCFYAQSQDLYPVKKDNKWGAINKEGKLIISPEFDFISDFKNGYAILKKDGKSGMLDASGKVLFPPTYDKIKPVGEKHFVVWKGFKAGLIDSENKVMIPVDYDNLIQLNDKVLAIIKSEKYGIARMDGQVVLAPELDKIELFSKNSLATKIIKNGKQGLLGNGGDILLDPKFDEIEVNGLQAIGKIGYALTVVKFDGKGELIDKKEYPNKTALETAQKAEFRKLQMKELQENPEAKKPRWVQTKFRYTLENGVGKNLLGGKEFYEIGIDEKLNLTLAKEVILPKQKGEKEIIKTYLIDQEKASIIFQSDLKDIIISDFNESEFARATQDTLWDALVNKAGEITSAIEGKTITNIGNFNSERALVRSGNSFGYIDTKANLVIPFQYEVGSDFKAGYAIARKSGKFGCIDQSGKEVLPFIYDGIDVPSDGICRVKKGRGREGKWGVVNLQNKEIVPFEYALIYPFKNGEARVRKNGKWGLISKTGKLVLSPSIDADFLEDFNDGIAAIKYDRWVEQTGVGPVTRYRRIGYIKRDGQVLIEPEYDKILGFEEAWTNKQGIATLIKGGKIGYVNYKGEIALPAKYDEVARFDTIWRNNYGISRAKISNQFGFIDHHGDEIVPVVYDFIDTAFVQAWKDSTGYALAKKEGKAGYIDYKGEIVIPFQYDELSEISKEVVIARKGEKWGVLNLDKEKVMDFEYDGIRYLPQSKNQILEIYKKDSIIHEISADGEIQATHTEFNAEKNQVAGNFTKSSKLVYKSEFDTEGFAIVEKGGKLAMADGKGNLITKYKFKEIKPFSDGLALVRLDDKDRSKQLYGYINKKGEEVIAPKFKLAKDFGDGKAAVLQRSTWGYIDKSGKMIIPQQYKSAGAFSGGYAIVNENQIIDKTGKVVGSFTLNGKVEKGFSNERAIVSSTTGSFHIKPDGSPAYFNKYDEVTEFYGAIAFVKKGEVWELTRKAGEQEITIRFNLANKNRYIEKYTNKRKEKLMDGTVIQDLKWTKIYDGKWRMIDKEGNLIGDIIYDWVKVLPSKNFMAKMEKIRGLADLNGKFLTELKYEKITTLGGGIIKLESGGKVGYLDYNGKWIWEVQ